MAYQYFVEPNHSGGEYTGATTDARRYGRTPVERETFNALWRCEGDGWEYFSLLDGDWHPAADGAEDTSRPQPPADDPAWRVAVDPNRASELIADFHHFTRFWVEYVDGSPRALVYRQVSTPERTFRGYFGRDGQWSDSSAGLTDFLTNGPHQQPSMVELEPREADQLIQHTLGITGAAQWWPRLDPDAAQFVVTRAFVLPGRKGTLVTGRLERGVISPPVEIWWKQDHYGTGYLHSHHLPVLAVEFPSPGSTARGEVMLVLDHSGIELDPGTTLRTLAHTSKPVPGQGGTKSPTDDRPTREHG